MVVSTSHLVIRRFVMALIAVMLIALLSACSRQGAGNNNLIVEELTRTNNKLEELSRKMFDKFSRLDSQVAKIRDTVSLNSPYYGDGISPRILGDTIESIEIYFDINDFELDTNDSNDLDAVARLMSQYPYSQLEISGFTDKTGPRLFNLTLSNQRAYAARRYLVGRYGIPLHRMHTVGLGPDRKKYPDVEKNQINRNRRIEINLLLVESGEPQP